MSDDNNQKLDNSEQDKVEGAEESENNKIELSSVFIFLFINNESV